MPKKADKPMSAYKTGYFDGRMRLGFHPRGGSWPTYVIGYIIGRCKEDLRGW